MKHFWKVERGGNQAALVFVHGLSGDSRRTWGSFPDFVLQDSALNHCDLVYWGYPTTLAPGITLPFVGSRLPEIPRISSALLDDLQNPRVAGGYGELVLVGHSMGGLVILQMALEARRSAPELLDRIRHVMLYATPTEGVPVPVWARWLRLGNRQIRMLHRRSEFIRSVGRGWREWLAPASPSGTLPTFPVWAVTGLQDNAVSEASARAFWGQDNVFTAPGNHTGVVKPEDAAHLSFQVLRNVVLRSTLTPFIRGAGEVTRVLQLLVDEAREHLYAVGSRSRDVAYLERIERQLADRPRLVYTRVLLGPPRRAELRDHLARVLAIRDPADRRLGFKTVCLANYDHPESQFEFALAGNERRCLVVLPSSRGQAGGYDSALLVSDPVWVQGMRDTVQALAAAGVQLSTPAAVAALPVVISGS